MIAQGQLNLVKPGDPISAELHNEAKRELRRLRGLGPAKQVMPHPMPKAEAGTGLIEAFQLAATAEPEPMMQDGYVYATRLSTEEERIKVARPNKLRTSTWSGQSEFLDELRITVRYDTPPRDIHNRRRAVRDDYPNNSEWQMIWPEYSGNDYILAVHLGEEQTRVDGVEWEEFSPPRRWTVLPYAFQGD